MKEKFYYLLFLILLLFSAETFAQNPTYILRATNLQYVSQNELTFEIFIQHTNMITFELAGAQYFFNFNTSIANGGTLTYSFAPTFTGDSSDLPFSMRPRNPTILGTSLRLAANTLPGAGNGYIISDSGIGTKIIKLKLSTSAISFSGNPLNLQWRNGLPNPFTKINAYVGYMHADITTPANHLIDFNPTYPELIIPMNNSLNNPLIVNFVWRKFSWSVLYKLQVSSDSTFGSSIIFDSTLTDTTKIVSGFLNLNKYFWRVISSDTLNQIIMYSAVWNFTTLPITITKINLKVTMEGIYYPLFHQLARRDTVTLYLRNSTSPYSKRDSVKEVIDSITQSGLFKFFNLPSGSYYLDVKHFNTIETWSKSGGEPLVDDGSVYNYDFTTSNSQAYGNNLILKGDKYCLYGGDVSQDGFVDVTDFIRVENDAYSFANGRFLPTDLNGDTFVDLSDILIVDNNAFNYIGTVIP